MMRVLGADILWCRFQQTYASCHKLAFATWDIARWDKDFRPLTNLSQYKEESAVHRVNTIYGM